MIASVLFNLYILPYFRLLLIYLKPVKLITFLSYHHFYLLFFLTSGDNYCQIKYLKTSSLTFLNLHPRSIEKCLAHFRDLFRVKIFNYISLIIFYLIQILFFVFFFLMPGIMKKNINFGLVFLSCVSIYPI